MSANDVSVKIMEKIGVMGGTFNPVHIGHLATAETVREEFSLDKIIFVPAAVPPHKSGRNIAPAKKRLAMTEIATASNPYFCVSAIEFEREGLSYTVDTIDELKKIYGDGPEIFFIVGADVVNDLTTWHNPFELLQKCSLIAATRPGNFFGDENLVTAFGEAAAKKIHRLTTPALEISSTDIRRRIKQGRSIRYIVPEPVADYIYREGLYR